MSERVPEGWESKKLDELVIKHNSGVYKKSNLYGSGTNIIGVSQLYQCDFVKGQKFKKVPLDDTEIAKFTLRYGDLLYGESSLVRSGIAKTVCVTPDGEGTAFAWHTRRYSVDQKFVYPEFLNYFVAGSKVRNYLEKVCTQTALTGITTLDYFGAPILLPPLPEQKKIASILTSVDEVIETAQKQIDKLQDLKKATMNELLTKGIGHTEFKDSELGRIPKSWEVKRLDEVSLEKGIQTGPFGSQLHAHEYTTDGVPVVMPKDMKPPLIDISDIARIPEHRAIDLSKHRVKKGDILFSRRGDIGRFALMEASSEGWVCGTGCLRVRLKNGVVHPYFIAQYLTKDEPKEWLNLNAVGLTMLNLSTSILEGLPLIVPSMEEQMTIVYALQSIDARLSKCRDYLSQTQSLKKSLMQDLLTGKVRVQVN